MTILIKIPTYNERDNIGHLINDILRVLPKADILIIDDDSADGTASLVNELASKISNIHLVIRKGKKGRGLADIEGFKYALKHQYDCVIEMDADFSHNPKYLPFFLEAIQENDLVIGSRLIKGGAIEGRGIFRNCISRLANIYIKFILGVPVKDATSGFRCFSKRLIENIPWDELISTGPSTLEETLYLAYKKRFRIKEIPIVFQDRKRGESKLGFKVLLSIMFLILVIKKRYA